MENGVMKADVEYLKAPPYGGNRYGGSDFARKQMIAAGHEIERLRKAVALVANQTELLDMPKYVIQAVDEALA